MAEPYKKRDAGGTPRTRAETVPKRAISIAALSDDIGKQPIFDVDDLILERELFLLQAANGELIGCASRFQGQNFVVKSPVLSAKPHEFVPKLPVVWPLHVSPCSKSAGNSQGNTVLPETCVPCPTIQNIG